MNPFLQLLIRHLLASAGGFFAAHQITGSSTSSIVVGLLTLAIPTLWSWIAKMFQFDESKGKEFINGSEAFRILLASLVSQGITALSVYLAVDANHPEILLGALVNAGASKFGLHQKAVGMPAAKLMIASLCLLSLSSCAGLKSFFDSDFGKVTVALVDVTSDVLALTGKIPPGSNILIKEGLAIVTDPNRPEVSKVIALKKLGLDKAIEANLLNPGDVMTLEGGKAVIQKAAVPEMTSAKEPVKVLPAIQVTASRSQKPVKNQRSQQDKPGCMQLADRIPVYGDRVAFMLSTADVRN